MTQLATELRYIDLWERSRARGDPVPYFRELSRRYSEPHRAYHTLRHINHCLDEFEAVRDLATDPLSVEWALWYHDAVYRIGGPDSEQQSADLARAVLTAAKVDEITTHIAASHIMATKHTGVQMGNDSQLVVDIDLAVLGQPANRYLGYQRQVTVEYVKFGGVDLDQFLRGRADLFLRPFLKRPRIYGTNHFRERYEMQARYNLVGELLRMNSPSWRQTVEGWVK